MPNFGQYFSGAAQGAGTGFALGGPVGAGIGGLIGLGAASFSKSPQDEWNQHIADIRKYAMEYNQNNEANRQRDLKEGSMRIGRLTAGIRANSARKASSRAAALGLNGDEESFKIPAEGVAGSQGLNALQNFDYSTNQAYNAKQLDPNSIILSELGSKPREETPLDMLGAVSPALSQLGMNNNYLDAYMERYGLGKYAKNTMNSPSVDTSWMNTAPNFNYRGPSVGGRH